MNRILTAGLVALSITLSACTSMAPSRPAAWGRPSHWSHPRRSPESTAWRSIPRARLLAGSVVGSSIWEVDRQTGAARVIIGAPEGQADDIAVGPKGELAWTELPAWACCAIARATMRR